MPRIGIDVGGTHTDGVLIGNNTIIKKEKVLTNHENLFESLIDVFNKLTENFPPENIKKITISSTLTTNLIIENKLPKVGLIISGGPGIKLDYFLKDENSFILDGFIDHRGRVIKDINLKDIDTIINSLIANDVHTCAVCTKFSVRNPIHEIKIKERIENFFDNVSCGHIFSGTLNFPRRINTSYLNAGVYNTNKKFLDSIVKFLQGKNINCPVFFLKADGGTFNINNAYEKPIFTVLSGQAAGVTGIMSLIDINEDCAAVIDIGGTSTDFSIFLKNSPVFEPEGIKINSFLTNVRSIYTKSIGLGGDSFIRPLNNNLKIGPERKGVAIVFGGNELTPTDVIFYLNGDNRPEKKLKEIADILNISIDKLCEEILKQFCKIIENEIIEIENELNSKPVYTIKEMVEFEEIKVKKIYLMGAPADSFKPYIEKYLNIPVEVVPHYEVVNAIGVAVSKATSELNLFADTVVGTISIPEYDFFEYIEKNFTLKDSYNYLEKMLQTKDFDIIEQQEFNVIKGFYTAGKTIRVKAQIKPGVEVVLK